MCLAALRTSGAHVEHGREEGGGEEARVVKRRSLISFDVRSVLLSTRDSRRPAGTMKDADGLVVVAAVEAMVESSCWKGVGEALVFVE